MIITEETSIKELFHENMISLETYSILNSKRLTTVGMILGFIGDAKKYEHLLTINGIGNKNYLQILKVISSLDRKNRKPKKLSDTIQNITIDKMTAKKRCIFLTTSIDELYEQKIISSKSFSLLERANLFTIEAILYKTRNLTCFETFSPLYRDTIKQELCNIVKNRDWLKVELCNKNTNKKITNSKITENKSTEKKKQDYYKNEKNIYSYIYLSLNINC